MPTRSALAKNLEIQTTTRRRNLFTVEIDGDALYRCRTLYRD